MALNNEKQSISSPKSPVESTVLSAAYLAFAELIGRRIAENWRTHAKAAGGSVTDMGAQIDCASTPKPNSLNARDPQTE